MRMRKVLPKLEEWFDEYLPDLTETERYAYLEKCIDDLKDEEEKEVLRRHLINKEKAEYIALQMYISYATVFRIQKSGMKHITEMVVKK